MRYTPAILAATAVVLSQGANPASAQELVFGFKNPSFGGNPFYSDHLLSIATAQRPERPRDESELAELTEGEQFARQLQSRLLSALSSSLVETITGSAPGTTGTFVVGDQSIFFERTLTQIRLVITNTLTGEITEIVVPVFNFNNPPPGGQGNVATVDAGPKGLMPGGLLDGSPTVSGVGDLVAGASLLGRSPLSSGSLDSGPIEPPVGGLGL